MVQYRATDGQVNDYHMVHLGKFALGKFGIVFTENCAIEPRGRVTQGDLGMWDDGQIEGHRRLTRFLQQEGALAATQITHAGRKASSPRQFDKPDEFGPVPFSVTFCALWPRFKVTNEACATKGVSSNPPHRANLERLITRFMNDFSSGLLWMGDRLVPQC